MTLTVLDLFSGIGAFTLGLQRAGMKTIAFCETDSFCRDILARHWPGVPILDDIRTADFPAADVVCGGFPCQDVSRAGKRAGITGERSGLYRELVRAIRVVRPRVAFVENVAALLGDGMGDVLGDLAEGGACVEWDCVPACALGSCHERDRVWIVAHADGQGRLQPEGCQSHKRRWSGDGVEARRSPDAAHADGVDWWAGASWEDRTETGDGVDPRLSPDPTSLGRGQRRQGRPPDSFARIRDEARRNAADPYGARLAFREGLGRNAWEKRATAERGRGEDVGQSIWPDEPALSGVDDEVADWAHRTKATGNALDPYIPELLATAVLEQGA